MSYNRRSADNVLSACSVIMALGLMAPAFWAGPLVLDEHAAYWLSAPDGSLSIWERSTRYAAAPPLANWAQAVSMRLLGETELALRLPSTLAYVAAVVVMGFGFRSSMGARAAALAACALALHPDVVDEVRVGRTYGFVVLVTTLLLLITFRWRSPRIVLREGLFWGLTAAAAVWTHVLTIPVVAISAVLLGICDVLQFRSLRPATVLGWVLAGLLCVPLVPMGERIWEWRYALNFQTGSVALREALGPVVWLALPLAAAAAVITTCFQQIRRGRSESSQHAERSPVNPVSAIVNSMVMGLLPLWMLVAAGQGDLSSLAHPRYRVPLAAASACLLGLLCGVVRRPALAVACLVLCLTSAWVVIGRSPLQLVRLSTPQAPVWKQIAETLEQTVREQNLQNAPVFVQSGLIEGILIPAYPEDVAFHGYVSSRLGQFYCRTDNPRYALPMFWGGDNAALIAFFERTLQETASRSPGGLFVAVATDTDVNRASFETFARFLDEFGYKGTVLAGQEPWAVLYHYRREAP